MRVDLFAGLEFGLREDALALKDLDRRLRDDLRESVRGRTEVLETALGGFLVPRFRVAVAVEDDSAVLGEDVLEDALERGVEIGVLLEGGGEFVGEFVERVSHDRVEHGQGAGDREGRADGAELELVTGEGERARAVTITSILREDGQRVDAEGHVTTLA